MRPPTVFRVNGQNLGPQPWVVSTKHGGNARNVRRRSDPQKSGIGSEGLWRIAPRKRTRIEPAAFDADQGPRGVGRQFTMYPAAPGGARNAVATPTPGTTASASPQKTSGSELRSQSGI